MAAEDIDGNKNFSNEFLKAFCWRYLRISFAERCSDKCDEVDASLQRETYRYSAINLHNGKEWQLCINMHRNYSSREMRKTTGEVQRREGSEWRHLSRLTEANYYAWNVIWVVICFMHFSTRHKRTSPRNEKEWKAKQRREQKQKKYYLPSTNKWNVRKIERSN